MILPENFTTYGFIGLIVLIGVIVFYFLIGKRLHLTGIRYKAVFLISYDDTTFERIGQKTYKINDTTIQFKEKSFIIPKDKNTYKTGKDSILFINFTKEKILNFHGQDMGIDAKLLDMLIAKGIIAQLVSKLRDSMQESNKSKWITFIIIFAFGAIAGYTIHDSMMRSQQTAQQTAQLILGVLKHGT